MSPSELFTWALSITLSIIAIGGAMSAAYALWALSKGITKRDYLAAKAMEALIASGSDSEMRGYGGWRSELAREAYRYADAMLVERAHGGGNEQ